MNVGFWLQYFVGWISIYLTLYIVRVLGKGMFTKWTPKYCFGLLILIIVFYTAGAICFFVPVTIERMEEYSAWHHRTHLKIPKFLDKFQEQYQCCGIHNYKDYNNPKIFGPKDPMTRKIDVRWTPDVPEYYTPAVNDTGENMKPPGQGTRLRFQYYFNVVPTCCTHANRIKFKNCHTFVEYDVSEYSNPALNLVHPNAEKMINNVRMGCFEKYETLMSNSIFQLNWLIGIMRVGSIIQAIVYFVLIWVYRLSLRAMKRNLKGEIKDQDEDDDDDDLLPFNLGKHFGRQSTTSVNAKDGGKAKSKGKAKAGTPNQGQDVEAQNKQQESLADVIKDFMAVTNAGAAARKSLAGITESEKKPEVVKRKSLGFLVDPKTNSKKK